MKLDSFIKGILDRYMYKELLKIPVIILLYKIHSDKVSEANLQRWWLGKFQLKSQ